MNVLDGDVDFVMYGFNESFCLVMKLVCGDKFCGVVMVCCCLFFFLFDGGNIILNCIIFYF